MTYALSQARRMTTDPVDYARFVIVGGCALALIAAGQILPF